MCVGCFFFFFFVQHYLLERGVALNTTARIDLGNDLKEAVRKRGVIVCSCAITAYFLLRHASNQAEL